MRVLFLVHAHPDLQAGGTEIFSRDLFRALGRRGIQGVYLAGTAAHQRSAAPGTPFQTVGAASDELLIWTGGFDPFFLSQVDLHGLSRPLADLVRQQRPDVIHIHHFMTLGAEIVGLVRRCAPDTRIVMTLHDYYPICPNDGQMVTTTGDLCHAARPDACRRCFPERSTTDLRLRQLHVAGALAQVDHFIAPSHFLRQRYIEWGLEADRISVLPNGAPAVDPVPARRTDRRDRFAFFGHINKFKGATVALEASAILSKQGVHHRLSLHGGMDYQTEQTKSRFQEVCDAAPAAKYHGRYERSQFPRLIADADWVVFPSQWWENAPLVIAEAFQHWRPIVCSDIGGAAEFVQDGVTGLRFPVGDAQSLAATMRRAIETPGLWQSLVDNIEPPVGIERSAERHETIYRELLASLPRAMAA